MAALQLITRCLEVTPVYTHTHTHTHTHPCIPTRVSCSSRARGSKKQIHSCGLITGVDSALSFIFRWEWKWGWTRKKKPKNITLQFFKALPRRGSTEDKTSSKTEGHQFLCRDKTWSTLSLADGAVISIQILRQETHFITYDAHV